MAADLADEVQLFVAPLILGGRARWPRRPGVGRRRRRRPPGRRPRLAFDGAPWRLGDDVLLVARRLPAPTGLARPRARPGARR
ncbi:MAG: hypothetical protein H6708_27110 [Kofleriaceae bacterium]|nr:hypothetical protein [Kofleriaceae bacterium]